MATNTERKFNLTFLNEETVGMIAKGICEKSHEFVLKNVPDTLYRGECLYAKINHNGSNPMLYFTSDRNEAVAYAKYPPLKVLPLYGKRFEGLGSNGS